jgi:hypothetical protein
MVPKCNHGKDRLPNLTIKKMPEPLYERLKERARLNRRSINSEVLAVLERELMPRPLTPEVMRERARLHRERLAAEGVWAPEPEELKRWIEEGRE